MATLRLDRLLATPTTPEFEWWRARIAGRRFVERVLGKLVTGHEYRGRYFIASCE